MKLFDVDWAGVLRNLPVWRQVPVEVRGRVLEVLKPSGGVAAEALGDEVNELRFRGIVTNASSTGKRVVLTAEWRETARVLRALDRHRIWSAPTSQALVRYLEEHFTAEDTKDLGQASGTGYGFANRQTIALLVESAEWVEDFLRCDSKGEAMEWARRRSGHSAPPAFHTSEVFEAARSLVRLLLPEPAGLPLAELPARLPGVALATLGAALHSALRFLLVYAGTGDGLEPRVGVWPGIAERLNRPPPTPPSSIPPEETFHSAWLMEDMTTVLVAASAEPLRLRGNDFQIFARARQQIAERLVSVPAWLKPLLRMDAESRIAYASEILRVVHFAEALGEAGTDLRLAPTRGGKKWLALSDRDRLAALLDALRASPERNPPSWYTAAPGWRFFPLTFGFDLTRKEWDLRRSLADAFLAVPPDTFVRVDAWSRFQREAVNPFLADGKTPRRSGFGYGRPPRREDWERLWGEVLTGFLTLRLAPLGGVRLGRLTDGAVAFALTGAGRYLLGAEATFEYGFEGSAEVIVQPNFEIVFLAPSPKAEARLARFAERIGAGVGAIFRITRVSVLAAAEGGLTAKGLIEALREVSAREVPANVERQIEDWLRGVRQVRTRRTVLVECPDAETASRVRAAVGKLVRPVTPTLLELLDSTPKTRSALVRQLRTVGIFVDA